MELPCDFGHKPGGKQKTYVFSRLQLVQLINELSSRTVSIRAFVQRVHYNENCRVSRKDRLQSLENIAGRWLASSLQVEFMHLRYRSCDFRPALHQLL